ncbi:hypothetical protein BGZ76_007640 [Entomortierella beljakovae]|nr:hypothetical protein BGZ76_007640 [Entomortierella beljakovae]
MDTIPNKSSVLGANSPTATFGGVPATPPGLSKAINGHLAEYSTSVLNNMAWNYIPQPLLLAIFCDATEVIVGYLVEYTEVAFSSQHNYDGDGDGDDDRYPKPIWDRFNVEDPTESLDIKAPTTSTNGKHKIIYSGTDYRIRKTLVIVAETDAQILMHIARYEPLQRKHRL